MLVRISAAGLLLMSLPSFAGQIFMLNGDVITGDIKKIWDEEVTIEPAYADEFNVDLDAVAYFESEREFDIEFADGREAVVTLVGGGDGLQVLEFDGVTQEVPVMQLAELDEPEDYHRLGLEHRPELDGEHGQHRQRDGRAAIQDEREGSATTGISANLSFAREEQNGVTVKEQDRIEYTYNWTFRDPWFLAINTGGERDPIRDLNHRINLGGGIGYNIWDDAGRFFQIQAVTGYLTEEFKVRDPNTGNRPAPTRTTA